MTICLPLTSKWIHTIEIVALNGRKIYVQSNLHSTFFQNTLRITTHGISSQQVVFRLKGLEKEVNGVVTLYKNMIGNPTRVHSPTVEFGFKYYYEYIMRCYRT